MGQDCDGDCDTCPDKYDCPDSPYFEDFLPDDWVDEEEELGEEKAKELSGELDEFFKKIAGETISVKKSVIEYVISQIELGNLDEALDILYKLTVS